MKKSSLLSLLTAAAIVTTSAGTFAAWDEMTKTSSDATLTIREKVTQTVALTNFAAVDVLADSAPIYTTSGEVTVANVPSGEESKYELQLTTEVLKDGVKNTELTAAANATLDTPEAAINGKHAYTVTITTPEATAAGNYTVKVTSKLIAKQP